MTTAKVRNESGMKKNPVSASRIRMLLASQLLGHTRCFFLNLYSMPSRSPSTIMATEDR